MHFRYVFLRKIGKRRVWQFIKLLLFRRELLKGESRLKEFVVIHNVVCLHGNYQMRAQFEGQDSRIWRKFFLDSSYVFLYSMRENVQVLS